VYPSSSRAACTRVRIAGEMCWKPLTTLDTVRVDTPARWATSRKVTATALASHIPAGAPQSCQPKVEWVFSSTPSVTPVTICRMVSIGSLGVPSSNSRPFVSWPVSMNWV
jgi:hypothetical protein